jgi:Putative arginyl-tRNA:protein arginylyltransferase
MILYSHPELSPPSACPILPDQLWCTSFFFAGSLSSLELSWFLSRGWRKFGHYFFRPSCPDCQACTPLRVPVERFRPSRSQERVLRRGAHIRTDFGPLRYEQQLFDLYHTHSQVRFGQESSFDEFVANLHSPSCPVLLSRYEDNGHLLGAGYLDQGSDGLSSVYFVFDPDASSLSLGTLSVLREIEEPDGWDCLTTTWAISCPDVRAWPTRANSTRTSCIPGRMNYGTKQAKSHSLLFQA